MLITPLIIYSIITSFAVRVFYHNRLMVADNEHQEFLRYRKRRLMAAMGILLCFMFFDTDILMYAEWFSETYSWKSFLPTLLAVGVLWVAKESTYKVQVLWHRYAPDMELRNSPFHRPKLIVSIGWNFGFWAFFLGVPWLPFRDCTLKLLGY